MKKFTIRSIQFILLFLFWGFLIQQIIFFSVRQISVGDFGVLNRITSGEINTDILVSGSSRGFVDFNPEIISKVTELECYNISQNGTRFGVQLPLLRTYLKHNKSPKILLQEIGVYSLALEDGINDEFKYLPYLKEDELYSGLLKLDHNLWMQKYVPVLNFYYFGPDFQRRIFRDLFLSSTKGQDYLIHGFHPNSILWNIDEDKFIARRPGGIYNRITLTAKKYLLQIIELCKEKNIKLVLVNTPEYYKILPLQNNREKIISIYKEIATANKIQYLDYSKSTMSKDRNYFYNFTHLNSKGAYKFSNILGNSLVSSGIIIRKDNGL